MRKRKTFVFCLSLLFLLLPLPVFASSAGEGVYDFYGILSPAEEGALEETISGIKEEYGFEAAILITEDVSGESRRTAAEFMQEYGIGDPNGMCLFHQPDSRSISVVFRGEAQEAFDEDVQDVILDHCVEYLQEGDTAGAYESALTDLQKGLVRFSRGKSIRPMDMEGPGMGIFILISLTTSCLVMAIPTFCIVMFQRSKMRTRRPQPSADYYEDEQGVDLDRMRDLYVRTTVTRTRIPTSTGGRGSGGSSGTFQSGGETFSGSERKY